MRKLGRLIVLGVTMPFLSGCFSLIPTPLPPTASEREDLALRGVVLGDPETGERVAFDEINDVRWSADSLSIVGLETGAAEGAVVTRTFALASVSALLVRQVDAGTTSGLIGGMVVGLVAVVTLLVTGKSGPDNP